MAEKPTALKALRQESILDVEKIIALLERGATARRNDDVFLPVRVHLFHRAQRGLWACVNSACPGRDRTIGDGWDFGAISPNRRTRCEHCELPVFELVACGECGQDYLSAEETFSGDTGEHRLLPHIETEDIDEFQLEVDPDDDDDGRDDEAPASSAVRRLICGGTLDAEDIETWRLARDRTLHADGDGIPVRLSPLDAGSVTCPCCGTRRRRLFREAAHRRAVRAVDHRADGPGAHPTDAVWCRRAAEPGPETPGFQRLAAGLRASGGEASAGGGAEPGGGASSITHWLTERKVADTSKLDALERQIEELRRVDSPALRPILEQKEAELSQARATNEARKRCRGRTPPLVSRTIGAIDGCTSTSTEQATFRATLDEFADFCLYREFFRRPKRMNSAETMGLVSLRYPSLEGKGPPPGWPLPPEEWTIFLKLVLDFFVRDPSAVQVEDAYLRWMGIPVREAVRSRARLPGPIDPPTTTVANDAAGQQAIASPQTTSRGCRAG